MEYIVVQPTSFHHNKALCYLSDICTRDCVCDNMFTASFSSKLQRQDTKYGKNTSGKSIVLDFITRFEI